MSRSLVALILLVLIGFVPVSYSAEQRYFEFTYRATLTDLPSNAEQVQLWLPYPSSDAHQTVTDMRIDSPYPIRITREVEYGNQILYVEAATPFKLPLSVQMTFEVLREEYVHAENDTTGLTDQLRDRLLQPDRLVPIDGQIAQLAAQTIAQIEEPEAKTWAIYDYVTHRMSYDKSGTGWGLGDALYACDVGKGNCTDFHSLIIGMARAAQIPAIFEIGFPLPATRGEGEITGYHCWAELYVEGKGWLPVDSSEANKRPEMFEYFYGNLCENRVQFTRERDITLNPPQMGPPLNYFIYPYAEVDGKPYEGVQQAFRFKDLPLPDWAQRAFEK